MHDMTDHHAHVQKRQVLADAVIWAIRERYERVRVVHEFTLRIVLQTFGYEPAIRPEVVRFREMPIVTVYGVGVNANLISLRDITAQYE